MNTKGTTGEASSSSASGTTDTRERSELLRTLEDSDQVKVFLAGLTASGSDVGAAELDRVMRQPVEYRLAHLVYVLSLGLKCETLEAWRNGLHVGPGPAAAPAPRSAAPALSPPRLPAAKETGEKKDSPAATSPQQRPRALIFPNDDLFASVNPRAPLNLSVGNAPGGAGFLTCSAVPTLRTRCFGESLTRGAPAAQRFWRRSTPSSSRDRRCFRGWTMRPPRLRSPSHPRREPESKSSRNRRWCESAARCPPRILRLTPTSSASARRRVSSRRKSSRNFLK